MEAVAIATPVDLAADLKYAEAQAQQLQESADSIMLHFVASQKAMAEELERETELHHSHLSARLKERRAHRAKMRQKSAHPGRPHGMDQRIQDTIAMIDTSLSKDQQVAALIASLEAL